MNSNLLVKGDSKQSLGAFVGSLSQSIGQMNWEERQSSNYVEERYFRSFVLGLELTAALADDNEFKDFEFWLCLQPEPGCRGDEPFLDGLGDCVARKLAQQGYQVIRPFNIGRAGAGGMVYRRNPEPNAKPRDRVLIEEV